MAEIDKLSGNILELIQKSRNILLHCHPFPDMDSICSSLAMATALKKMGKNVTPILGDSLYPNNLKTLPNNDWIQEKNFTQIDPTDFDLFIILDSSTPTQITKLGSVTFPDELMTVVVDHHKSNLNFGKVNLVDPQSASTTQILYRLFRNWGVEIDQTIALYIFLGIYADTGGFKFPYSSPDSIQIAAEMVKVNPNYHQYIYEMANKTLIELTMMGLALSNLRRYYADKIVITAISRADVEERKLTPEEAGEGLIGDTLRSVPEWEIVASLVEVKPNIVTVSMRTRYEDKYDLSLIARSVGENGGGHRGAAGTTINLPLDAAVTELLEKIVKLYPNLDN